MVKKSKGLSFDEKKSVLSAAMIREGMYYNLKELEVLGKKNGVIPQAVKEVVDCLVGDRVIIQEKIGSLNIFWAFASNERSTLENQLTAMQSNLKTMNEKYELKAARLAELKVANPCVTALEVATSLKQVSELGAQCAELEKVLNGLRQSDPAAIAALHTRLKKAKQKVNMHTDNIFVLAQFLSNKMGVGMDEIKAEFGIPADIDFLDL